jgi:Ca2+-transporting ATPase
MPYYTKTVRQTLDDLKVSENGLAMSEAEERKRIYGPNSIKVKGEPLWRKLIEPFASVFMLVLFLAGAISLFHGDILDASIVGAIMAANALIYYVQRFSTERILRSLQKHNRQIVEVLRENRPVMLDTSELVPGDIILLGEGEKIPADARIISASSLRTDESQLTGESEPIGKQPGELAADKEVYEQSNMLFQGSFIVSGSTVAVVAATGNNTQFGRLAALTERQTISSPSQIKTDKLISQIIAIVAVLAVVAFGLSLFRGMDPAESLRFVLALSVSAVPESLPVAISVVLVLGMRRMAAKKALVRNMRAIETIGTITTIATDKTGTLTKNKLTVQSVWNPHGTREHLTQFMAKAINHSAQSMHDPLDSALMEFAHQKRIKVPTQPALTNFPFTQSVSMSGNLWHDGALYRLVVKGAPEQILARSDLTESEREEAEGELQRMTGEGFRVIAIAHMESKDTIKSLEDLKKGGELSFVGFVAVADILRPEASKAIRTAIKAGVAVRMITGDHFETAYHIAKQLGMVQRRDQVFDSRRISTMSDEELEQIIDSIRVFSRVIPEHKYRILALLKKHNITAMTGDGVNDVPALTNAHVGIAMGSGASIAKDAGDIILIDDNFKSIVDAMREGRAIFANVRRMLFYLLSTNTGEVLTTLGALVIGLPVPLAPVQILWINLVTDTSMVIPLGLEPGEKHTMTTAPKRPDAPILSWPMVSRMILLAVIMASLTLGLYVIYSTMHGNDYGRTIAFNSLVVMQWASAFSARSDTEALWLRLRVFNRAFYAGLAIAVSLQLLVILGPLGDILHVASVGANDLIITSLIAFVTPIIFMEIHKAILRKRHITP